MAPTEAHIHSPPLRGREVAQGAPQVVLTQWSSPLWVGQSPDAVDSPTRRLVGTSADIPLCSTLHSPLHKSPKPGWAADESLRGVHLLQEVIREALDDGLHV